MGKKKKNMSINRWMDKQIIHILPGYTDKWISKCCRVTQQCYSAMKTNEVLTHATIWMNLENIMLSEISQRQKNKCDTIKYVVFVSMNLLILGKRLSKGWGKKKTWWCVRGGVEIIMATKFLLFGVMKDPGNRQVTALQHCEHNT